MRYVTVMAVVLACAGVCLSQEAGGRRTPRGIMTPRPEGEEWVDLLAPERWEAWESNVKLEEVFRIDDGALHVLGQRAGAHVGYMAERFRNFELHLEFKVSTLANSGVVLRAEADDPLFTGMEVQVFDDHGRDPTKYTTGALYDVATPMFNMSFPAGEWNSMDIICQERMLQVSVNGWKVLDVDLSKMTLPLGRFTTPYAALPLDGHLMLQSHQGEVWYRNIVIKKL